MTNKRNRLNIEIHKEEVDFLEKISLDKNWSTVAIARKAIRILMALYHDDCFLTTKSGERIPKSVIFP